jgi:PAB-dependent poly(A)-specific ribonuclease subunit 3
LNLNLPDELQGYHSLVPLENAGGERRKFGNWYSTVYRAVSSTDGTSVVLRRIESKLSCNPLLDDDIEFMVDFRLMHQAAFSAIETWSRIRHPAIVSVREAFTTRAFNDNCPSFFLAYF